MRYQNASSHHNCIIIIIIIKLNYPLLLSRYSDYATAWTIEELWSDSRPGEEIFEASRRVLGPTQ
jgi:hypothetical protein